MAHGLSHVPGKTVALGAGSWSLLRRVFRFRLAGIATGLVALVVLFANLSEPFLSVTNLLNITRQVSILAILSVGMTIAIISGGIDLSVGSIIAFVGVVVAGALTNWALPVWLAIVVGLLVGALIGAVNGSLIAFAGVPPFIATLGTMTAFRGLTFMYTDGYPIYNLPRSFGWLGAGYVAGIPVPTILMVIAGAVAWVALAKTPFGVHIYAIGANETAARRVGVRVVRTKLLAYIATGVLAAVSAIVLTARLRAGLPTSGFTYELTAIAAVILGGTSISGGIGSVVGTILGALLLGVLSNGLTLLNVEPYVLEVITGAVIIVAVLLDSLKNKQVAG
jgi:ribose transport system permease protein